MLFCHLLTFSKINFLQKFFHEYHQSVKQFRLRSGPTFFPNDFFQTVCKGYQHTAISRQRVIQCSVITAVNYTGLQIYGEPGSLSHDFKIWPTTFLIIGPIHFGCEKNLTLIKKIHLTASLRTPQNRKYM